MVLKYEMRTGWIQSPNCSIFFLDISWIYFFSIASNNYSAGKKRYSTPKNKRHFTDFETREPVNIREFCAGKYQWSGMNTGTISSVCLSVQQPERKKKNFPLDVFSLLVAPMRVLLFIINYPLMSSLSLMIIIFN